MALAKVAEHQKFPGRLMSRHLLGALKPSVVFQVNRDAGCSPSVTPTEVRKPDGLARFQLQPRRCIGKSSSARPVSAVPSELRL